MDKELRDVARKLRKNFTEAEKQLWYELRAGRLGVKFRRQSVIGQFIVDFVCFEKKLIVEVDGGQHSESVKDKVRDEWFKTNGFRVLRFWNNEVLENQEGVLKEILGQLINTPSPWTLPTREREKRKSF
ncbi:MAG: endonuclease domain-containing protein [Chlamydiae bacterium]|nr:endonuclease domain-containing protein [Chlamydiota bacterium]